MKPHFGVIDCRSRKMHAWAFLALLFVSPSRGLSRVGSIGLF